MNINISISGKSESERLISIIQLGLLSALEKQIISIEEAEGYLFSPYTAQKLEMYGLSKQVIDIVWEGCELEDIQSLLPEKLLPVITRIKEQVLSNISTIPNSELPKEKIIK